MKKIICMLLVLALCFCMVGCDSTNEDGEGETSKPNTFETPIEFAEKFSNYDYKSLDEMVYLLSNDLLKAEIADLASAWMKSDDFEERVEDTIESAKEANESGNYKIEVKIDGKEALEKSDLKDYEEELKEYGESIIENMVEVTEGFDDADWIDFAEELECTVQEAKDIVKALKAFAQALKNLNVEEGYVVECTMTMTRTYDGETSTDEQENDLYIYKVNGRWIYDAAFSNVYRMFRGNVY